MTAYLHSDDGVYEEKHGDEKTDVRKRLLGGETAKTVDLNLSQRQEFEFVHVS